MEEYKNTMTIVVIVQDSDHEPEKCIESIIACNDVENVNLIVYNNSKNEAFNEWASAQENFLYAYSEKGVEYYGNVVKEILCELDIHNDVLLVNGHHMAYPQLISKMYNTLHEKEYYGIVAASFNGAELYGLSYETFAMDYIRLAELSPNYEKEASWEGYYIDPESSILIRDTLVELLKEQNNTKCDRKDFFKSLEQLVIDNKLSIRVLASGFWWNLQDNTLEKLSEIKNEGVKLTIAIPTYNRANRTLAAVKYLISSRKEYSCEDIVEILVSDNCSSIHLEELEELEKLVEEEKNVSIYRSEINKGYKGNIKKIIEMSKGKYCLIQSDEDITLFPEVLWYLRYLELHPDVSCMKGRTDNQYASWKTSYGLKGMDAVYLFYLRGNYVSGVIYNREIISNDVISKLYRLFDNENAGFDFYPHLFIEAYALRNGSFASSNITLIREGIEEDSGDHMGKGMYRYEYPESRIGQGKGYIKQLEYLALNDRDKMLMYNIILRKTIFLLNLSKKKYIANGYEWDDIVRDTIAMFREGLQNLKIYNMGDYKKKIFEYLELEEKNKLS